MNTLHSTSTSAVVTRLHDVVVRNAEKSGAVSGRGCARGTGRQHTTFMSVVDANVGGSTTGATGVA
ncbi:SigE family RNA polymerase sigma factor, partial [Streptomyces sp. MB09-02B]|nr:SigE family RNA polymerase sigma factor [Streptomyces sp. MB09-02B]